jgi:PAS domain S-box-containing protein
VSDALPLKQQQIRQQFARRAGVARQRGRLRQGALLACVVLASLVQVAVATPARLADYRNLIFDRLGTESGLSQAAVSSITQDQDGFIWIGTQEGLNRFDGYHFETFYHRDDDPHSLSHDSIWDLLADSQGNLWVGTDAGLNRYNEASNNFENYPLDEVPAADQRTRHGSIHTLFEDSRGRVWIGTGAGLVALQPDQNLIHYHHDPALPGSISRGSVRAVFEDSGGRIWIGTELGGLNLLDETSQSFEHYVSDPDDLDSISDNYIRFIIEAAPGKLWLATFNGGVSILDTRTGSVERLTNTASARVRSLLKDQDGDIWVGTDSGLQLWNAATRDFARYTVDPTDVHSISDNTVFELFQDRGGVIWVGTFNGLSKWNARTETFPHFKQSAGRGIDLSSNSITSFAESPQGDIWIGTFEGLNKWDKQLGRFINLSNAELGKKSHLIMSMAVHDEVLWVGTMAGGITLLKDNRVIGNFSYDPNDASSISSNAVSRIYVDSQNRLWLTTYGGGVNLYLGDGKFRRYQAGSGTNADGAMRALDILEVPGGGMWVATDGAGVMVLDPNSGRYVSLTHKPDDATSLSSNNVISLLSANGVIWVGTRDRGMNRYIAETMSFDRYTKAEGLSSDAVYGMLEDNQGRIWVSGGKGLSVLDVKTAEFTIYDATHGLQSDDFNSGAYLKMADGSFLFGGSNGFNAFDPARIKGNSYVPPIRITQFSKFNKPQQFDQPISDVEEIRLDYNDFVIGFEFSAMDFTAPQKNRFSYMLEGFDREWVLSNGTRQVTYTNLDAGNYTFKVKGTNNDGVWNVLPTTVGVVVLPPVWATWWAYLIYVLLAMTSLYQLQKANARRLRRDAEQRYNERLQLYIESLEEATDCVLIADANKNLMYANHAIEPILGLSADDAVGRSVLALLFADAEDARRAEQGLQRDGRWHGEVKSRKGLLDITTDVTLAAVHDDEHKKTAFVSIARDVTDRKRTESELDNHRRNLEFLVTERTKELEHEIAENKQVQHELAESLREKELLLKEVHHRVKNNMQVISSLLNIQAETNGNEAFANLLGESQQRIKSMALIHENLYQAEDLLEIDFDDYINMLANSLCRFYAVSGVAVNLDIRVEDVSLDIESAVPCGLIINELISNSLKHAFIGREGRGTIWVDFARVGCRYVLRIGDDGVGLPVGFDIASSSTMGMEIVSILTQQLDGQLRTEAAKGACFEISFPRKAKHAS